MRSVAHHLFLFVCALSFLTGYGSYAAISVVELGSTPGSQPSAGTISLVWNESPDALVTGYYLYYGVNGGGVTNRLDVGNQSYVTLAGLADPGVYAFEVSAYDADGHESARSNSIQYVVPVPAQTLSLTSYDAREKTMVMSFPSVSGVSYRLEFSVDLTHWQTVSTINNAPDGSLSIPLKIDAASQAGFYRLARN